MTFTRSIAVPRPRPRVLEKRDTKRKDDRAEVKFRAAIRQRDGHTCRACGVFCVWDSPDPLKRAEVHHIRYRSAGGKDTLENAALLCHPCHAAEHAGELAILGTNANKPLRFVRRKP